jgi:hypothetical protein
MKTTRIAMDVATVATMESTRARALDEGGEAGLETNSCSVLTSRISDLLPFNRLLVTALAIMEFLITFGEMRGLDCKYNAATPAICGDAMDVPLRLFVASSLLNQLDSMSVPYKKYHMRGMTTTMSDGMQSECET